MTVLTEIQKNHEKEIVKRLLMFNPGVSVAALKERLDTSTPPINIGIHQLHKIVASIREERIARLHEETKEDLYTMIADTVEWVNNQLRAIAQEEKLVYTEMDEKGNAHASPKMRIFAQQNRTKALNSVVDNLIKLVNLKMDLGIIDRNLGTGEIRVYDMVDVLEKIRNGDYTTSLPELFARRAVASGTVSERTEDAGQSS